MFMVSMKYVTNMLYHLEIVHFDTGAEGDYYYSLRLCEKRHMS